MFFENIKAFINEAISTFNDVAKESAEFRAQEPPLRKPVETKKQETALTTSAVNQMEAYFQAQKECAVLASHIVEGMKDFPSSLNIEPYEYEVAVPVQKINNGLFLVKLYKTDPEIRLSKAKFENELRPELNRRFEKVRLNAVEENYEALDDFNSAFKRLQMKYGCDDPLSYIWAQDDYAQIEADYNNTISKNTKYLNPIWVNNYEDKGVFVLIFVYAGWNGVVQF